ncbi:hypothetical protein FJZ20_00205 [Candidatus Pacearchaeota archaeon]|nr:hypothetical protein [Candidatus Pacearchaeota archaeon]
MIGEILTFQIGSFYGGSIGGMLAYWESAGFFSYILPFLLIFALVFGILTRVKMFDNKGINAVIALVVGLLALQFHFVPIFFSEIFPRLGIGLAVILALLILGGLFFDPDNKMINYGLLGVGVIVFLVVLVQTFGWLGWWNLSIWSYNWQGIVGIILFLAIIGIIVGAGGKRKPLPDYKALAFRSPVA